MSLGSFNGEPTPNVIAREAYGGVVPLTMSTNVSGATFNPFPAQACQGLDVINNTGTTIEYRRGVGTIFIPIPTGASRLIQGIANANEISVRRVDQGAIVAVVAEAFAA